IVQQQHRLLVVQVVFQRIGEDYIRYFGQPQDAGDLRYDHAGISDLREGHKKDAIGEIAVEIMTYLHAQPRFADAWWPVQGEQAYILAQQERGDSFQLLGTVYKRRSRCGHPPRKLEWRASLRTPRLRAGRFKLDAACSRDRHRSDP